MKLDEVTQQKQKGTYAGAHFDTPTKKALHKYMSDNDIPNALRPDKLHSTILHSKKYLPDYQAKGKYDEALIGKPKELVVWKTSGDDSPSTRCLVLKYECPKLVKRHEQLMKQHDAQYDFPEYIPHVTLSYDIGDFDEKKLPLPEFDIVLDNEYQEDLDLNWAQNKGGKK